MTYDDYGVYTVLWDKFDDVFARVKGLVVKEVRYWMRTVQGVIFTSTLSHDGYAIA